MATSSELPQLISPTYTLKAHEDMPTACAVTPDGGVAISLDTGGRWHVWNPREGTRVKSGEITVSRLGNFALSEGRQDFFNFFRALSCSLSEDGSIAAFDEAGPAPVQLWSVLTAERLETVQRQGSAMCSRSALSADGRMFHVWSEVSSPYVEPCTSHMALGDKSDVSVIGTRSGEVLGVALSGDASIAAISWEGAWSHSKTIVEVLDARTGDTLFTRSADDVLGVGIAVDGRGKTVVLKNQKVLKVISVRHKGAVERELHAYRPVFGYLGIGGHPAISTDGTVVVAVEHIHKAYGVWNAATGARIATLEPTACAVEKPFYEQIACAVNKDGTLVITTGFDESVYVWDTSHPVSRMTRRPVWESTSLTSSPSASLSAVDQTPPPSARDLFDLHSAAGTSVTPTTFAEALVSIANHYASAGTSWPFVDVLFGSKLAVTMCTTGEVFNDTTLNGKDPTQFFYQNLYCHLAVRMSEQDKQLAMRVLDQARDYGLLTTDGVNSISSDIRVIAVNAQYVDGQMHSLAGALKLAHQAVTARLSNLEAGMAGFGDALGDLKHALVTIDSNVRQLALHTDQINADVGRLSGDINCLGADVSVLDANMHRVCATVRDIGVNVSRIDKNMSRVDGAVEHLGKRVIDLDKDMSRLDSSVKQVVDYMGDEQKRRMLVGFAKAGFNLIPFAGKFISATVSSANMFFATSPRDIIKGFCEAGKVGGELLVDYMMGGDAPGGSKRSRVARDQRDAITLLKVLSSEKFLASLPERDRRSMVAAVEGRAGITMEVFRLNVDVASAFSVEDIEKLGSGSLAPNTELFNKLRPDEIATLAADWDPTVAVRNVCEVGAELSASDGGRQTNEWTFSSGLRSRIAQGSSHMHETQRTAMAEAVTTAAREAETAAARAFQTVRESQGLSEDSGIALADAMDILKDHSSFATMDDDAQWAVEERLCDLSEGDSERVSAESFASVTAVVFGELSEVNAELLLEQCHQMFDALAGIAEPAGILRRQAMNLFVDLSTSPYCRRGPLPKPTIESAIRSEVKETKMGRDQLDGLFCTLML